jgi:transposase
MIRMLKQVSISTIDFFVAAIQRTIKTLHENRILLFNRLQKDFLSFYSLRTIIFQNHADRSSLLKEGVYFCCIALRVAIQSARCVTAMQSEKTDTRKLKPAIQQQLRHQVIRLRKAGKTYKEIGDMVGVHPTNACKWFKAYEAHGIQAIQSRKRGRKIGSCRTLRRDQEKRLQKVISNKTPDQFKLPFALWTRRAAQQLILHLFEIQMPIRTVGEYLSRLGFNPQKRLRMQEQHPVVLGKWLKVEYQAIAQKAKQHRAEIYWGDETVLKPDFQRGQRHSACLQRPVVRLCGSTRRITMVCAINNQGTVRFMVCQGATDAKTMVAFLERLIKDSNRKVFLIWNNPRVHHVVKEWLQAHNEQIELFILPACVSDICPDEHLNCA